MCAHSELEGGGGNLSEKTRELLGKGRIEALSDGVFAIVVTLLVLELRVPEITEAGSVDAMAAALLSMAPKLLSLVISFLTVCVIWLNHHRLFTLLDSVDVTFFWLNANLLLWVSVIPFPTAIIGDYPSNPLALSFYGVVMALMAAAFVFMRMHMQKTRCFHPDVNATGVSSRDQARHPVRPCGLPDGCLGLVAMGPAGFCGVPRHPHLLRAAPCGPCSCRLTAIAFPRAGPPRSTRIRDGPVAAGGFGDRRAPSSCWFAPAKLLPRV